VAGPAALYADLHDEGALTAALSEALDDGRRDSLAKTARSHVESRFSQEVVVRQMVDMYQTVHRSPQ
jgi:glycosyltransferase involved in cell wall biosynthesis